MSATPVLEGTTPIISDTFITTYQAGEDLVPGVLVELSGDWTVKKTTGAQSMKVRGVTLTKAANGQKVSVISRGLVRVLAYGTLTAGDQVGSQNYGSVVTDNANKNTTIFGQVIQGASSGGTAVIALW
jgi:hypothetical protein